MLLDCSVPPMGTPGLRGQPEARGDRSGGFLSCVCSLRVALVSAEWTLTDVALGAGELVQGSGAVSPSLLGL